MVSGSRPPAMSRSRSIRRPATGPRFRLEEFPGKVTAVHFSADGTKLVTASGVAGLAGEAGLWNPADGSLIRRFRGHRDLLFDAELSPDGRVLATSGYDRAIRLWDSEAGKLLRTLEGHNGAVYDLRVQPRRTVPRERERRRYLQNLAGGGRG